jgi:hypothetical protein
MVGMQTLAEVNRSVENRLLKAVGKNFSTAQIQTY